MIAKINKVDLSKLKTFTKERKTMTKEKDNLLNGEDFCCIFISDYY